jgi:hypothetical protein
MFAKISSGLNGKRQLFGESIFKINALAMLKRYVGR